MKKSVTISPISAVQFWTVGDRDRVKTDVIYTEWRVLQKEEIRMPRSRLLPTREVARLLELPESTVRWYERQFRGFLPVERTGRGVGWHAEALPILRTIRESFAAGLTREDVAQLLTSGLPKTDPSPATEQTRKTVVAAVMARSQALETIQADLAQLKQDIHHTDLEPFLIRQTEQLTRIERSLNTLPQALQRLEGRIARLEQQMQQWQETPETPESESDRPRWPWPRHKT